MNNSKQLNKWLYKAMLLLLVAFFTNSILAQSHRGELKGVIVDQNKQTIIGAATNICLYHNLRRGRNHLYA